MQAAHSGPAKRPAPYLESRAGLCWRGLPPRKDDDQRRGALNCLGEEILPTI